MARPPVEPDFQWTFEAAPDPPADAEVKSPDSAQNPADSRSTAVRPARLKTRRTWRLTRRAALLVTLTVALLAAGAGLFRQNGWRNLRAQIAAEIAYEDTQSAAGAVDVILGLQAEDQPAWANRRAAETRLGLTAAQPGADLLPVPGSAELLDLTAVAPGVFVATVQRRYTDSAGQAYTFTLTQRYLNLRPGEWARLGPDEAALTATNVWRPTQGYAVKRLVVTYPAAERDLLARILPLVEGYAQAACADWLCPPELVVPLVVTGRLADLPAPGYAPRTGGPLPIGFDLAQQPVTDADGRRVIVAAPALVGHPADAAAEAALARAWGASVLAFLANELAGSARHPVDDYLDALIAREELRLGLSSAPDLSVAPLDYLPIEQLWATSQTLPPAALALARRQQALSFLNSVLPNSADGDGRLLRTLRTRTDIVTWLADRIDVAAKLAEWHAGLLARLNGDTAIPAAALDGAAYACGSGAWFYRGNTAQPLGTAPTSAALDPNSLSPDGRYFATVSGTVSEQALSEQQLTVYDRANGTLAWVAQGSPIILAGWAANGDLLFYQPSTAPVIGLALMRAVARYDFARPPERVFGPIADPTWSALPPRWSQDHTQLAVTVLPNPNVPAEPQAGVVEAATGRLVTLPEVSYAPALTPDGQAVAYVALRDQGGTLALAELAHPDNALKLVDIPALRADGHAAQTFRLLDWSPDGQTLAFIGVGSNDTDLYVLDRATRRVTFIAGGALNLLPVGFSADSRYLAYLMSGGPSPLLWLVTRDLTTGAETRYAGAFSHLRRIVGGPMQLLTSGAAAWSPEGHLLLVSSQSGIFVFDPATAATRWLTYNECGRAVWYDLPG